MWEPHSICKELMSRHSNPCFFYTPCRPPPQPPVCVCLRPWPCEQLRDSLQRACFLFQSYETWDWNSDWSSDLVASWSALCNDSESLHWPYFWLLNKVIITGHGGACLLSQEYGSGGLLNIYNWTGLHSKYQTSQGSTVQHDHVSKLKINKKVPLSNNCHSRRINWSRQSK